MLSDNSRNFDFPTLQGMVYLNTAAEGIPPPEVHEALEGSKGRSKGHAQRSKGHAQHTGSKGHGQHTGSKGHGQHTGLARSMASGFGRRGVPGGRLVAQPQRQARDVIEFQRRFGFGEVPAGSAGSRSRLHQLPPSPESERSAESADVPRKNWRG
jgi:hypothetical protein